MDMDQAAVFLAGSILTGLGFVVVFAVILAINNMIHKYWKPVTLVKWEAPPPMRFATQEELEKIDPKFKKK
jgi:hypothetical protein